MQKTNLLTISALLLVVISCGQKEKSIEELIAGGDLEAIRAKRKELSAMQKELQGDLTLLNKAIDQKSEKGNLPLVTVMTTDAKEFFHFVELQGDVTTKQNVLVYPEVQGALVAVKVQEGDKVKKGEVLAVIDDGGSKSQLIQMETQLALSKTTFERQERLWNQKIGSEIQYLQAKTNYEAQKSAVTQMKSQLDKFNVRAPFNGVVDDVIKDEGTVVAPGPGSEIFRVVNLSNMYIEVDVPETYVTSIVPGKEANVYFPILNETIASKVRETGNFINPENRTFDANVPVPNRNGMVKPNLTAKVRVNDYYSSNAILIPQSVISENAEGDQYVFLITQGSDGVGTKVKKTIIETGLTQDGQIEILAGLKSGDQIVIEGARSVKDGLEVKILSEEI